MTRRIIAALYTTTVALALAGALLWVLPTEVGVPEATPIVLPTVRSMSNGTSRAATLLEYEVITQNNVFAVDRAAPANRYRPPGEPDPSPPPSSPVPRIARYTLYGVASGPSGAVALIDADRTIPGAEIYRRGDDIGAYRLETVGDAFVVLRRGVDSLVLRLELPPQRLP